MTSIFNISVQKYYIPTMLYMKTMLVLPKRIIYCVARAIFHNILYINFYIIICLDYLYTLSGFCAHLNLTPAYIGTQDTII